MGSTELTPEQKAELDLLFERAYAAQKIVEGYDQERLDRIIRRVCWALTNKRTFGALVEEGIVESGLGDYETRLNKRNKIRLILREALRHPSVGIVEEIPEKGIVKYAKPVGIIASLVPTTNPDLTPGGQAIYGIKARNALIFSPHPRSKRTTYHTVEIMREALIAEGAPADLLQCITLPSIPMTNALMARADLVIATGGRPMVHAAYSSGTPAYGSGAGNASMIFDETADVQEACHNTMLSKTSDFGSGCSADGNIIVHESIYDAVIAGLQKEGGYLAEGAEREALKKVMWDEHGHRLADTVAVSPQQMGKAAGFEVPADRKFIFVIGGEIGKEHFFSSEKLTTVLAVFKYEGEFENALDKMRAIYEVGGKGHSVGIYSWDDDHIHRLGLAAPVSRIMVRQAQSKANAGAATNGMPPTSSMSCGTWGGNFICENIWLKHYMNYTWVSRPIAADMPSPEELFGEFYDPELDK